MTSSKKLSTPIPEIRRATFSHIPSIQYIVTEAYTKYIPRIGKLPAPMLADYNALLANPIHEIFVLLSPHSSASPDSDTATESTVVGSILLNISDSAALRINNLVVDPSAQGKGYGRLLMRFAEERARDTGRGALELYTNVKMVENLEFYAKLGFLEVGRREEDGYERVFFKKDIS
ncbi:acyl-CoA N-acyltransferase [Aspergillus crustosus]